MLERVDFERSSFKQIAIRSVKKLLVESTSLKFLTLIFVGYLTAQKIITDFVGIGAMLTLLGIREGFEYLSGKSAGNFRGTQVNIDVEGTKAPKIYE